MSNIIHFQYSPMECLPAEIVSEIVQYIASDTSIRLNNYACVYREWQAAVERLTFSSLKIKTTDFETLSTFFASGNVARARMCKALHVNFSSLPCYYGDDPDSVRDTFSDTIAHLFNILSNIASRIGNPPAIELQIGSDATVGCAFDLHMSHSVPPLPQVTAFAFLPWQRMSSLHPPAVFLILLKLLPNMRTVHLSFWDNIENSARKRRLKRKGDYQSNETKESKLTIRRAQ